MTKIKVHIDSHDGCDKNFEMNLPHCLAYIDYDDVNHSEVDAAVETLKEIIEKYWDEDLYKKRLKEILIQEWNKNEYNLQDDYDSLEEYLQERGIK